MIPRRSSGHLYEVLEIEKTASPDEVKKAYRKKALQLHPDKTNGTTTEEFKQVQEANAILSDPEKRKLYDTFGRSGMAKMEQYGMGGAAASVLEHPLALRALAFVFWLNISLVLIFVSLYVVKVDSSKSWSWNAVFTPVWIFSVIIIPAGVFLILGGAKSKRPDQAFSGIAIVLFIVTCVFYCKAMEDKLPDHWKNFFTVALVMLGFWYLGELIGLRPSAVQELLAAQGHPAATQEGGISITSPVYLQMVISVVFNMICILVFTCLMRDRLCNESSSLSFYEVFTPLFIRYSIPALLTFLCGLRGSNMTVRQGLCLFIFTLLLLSGVLYTYVMTAVKLQKEWLDRESGPSAAVCAIMIFITLGIANLASCCACCCISRPEEEGYSDVTTAENGGTDGPSTTENRTEEAGTLSTGSPIITAGPASTEPKEPTTYYNSLD